MPATPHPYRTSRLSELCFQLPNAPARREAAPSMRGRRAMKPRVNERIARASNASAPCAPTTREALRSRLRTPCAATMRPPDPEPTAPTWNGLTLYVRPLSPEADAITKNATISSALMSIAAVCSGYWYRSLQGPPLGVLDTDGNVVCRISPSTDGATNARPTDALVVLKQDNPPAYQAVNSNTRNVETFYHAAVQAERWRLMPLAHATPEGYRDVIATHAATLDASMSAWIRANQGALDAIESELLTYTR